MGYYVFIRMLSVVSWNIMVPGEIFVFGCLYHLPYVIVGIVSIVDSYFDSDLVSPSNLIQRRASILESCFRCEFKFGVRCGFQCRFELLVGWCSGFRCGVGRVGKHIVSWMFCSLCLCSVEPLLFCVWCAYQSLWSVAGSRVCHGEVLGVMCLCYVSVD